MLIRLKIELMIDFSLDQAVRCLYGRGSNVVEAHSRLRRAIVEDRVGLGLRILV